MPRVEVTWCLLKRWYDYLCITNTTIEHSTEEKHCYMKRAPVKHSHNTPHLSHHLFMHTPRRNAFTIFRRVCEFLLFPFRLSYVLVTVVFVLQHLGEQMWIQRCVEIVRSVGSHIHVLLGACLTLETHYGAVHAGNRGYFRGCNEMSQLKGVRVDTLLLSTIKHFVCVRVCVGYNKCHSFALALFGHQTFTKDWTSIVAPPPATLNTPVLCLIFNFKILPVTSVKRLKHTLNYWIYCANDEISALT